MRYTICKLAANFFKHFFLLQLLVLLCSLINAQPKLVFTPLIKNISDAVDIKNANDSSKRLFIVRQSGIINIYQYGVLSTRPFLDINDRITYKGEQGLFSLAFHPGYKNNGLFFIWYSDKKGDVTLARYKASDPGGDVADPYSGVVLFSLSKPGGYNNHNGGCLQFGKDGYLYLTIGDGGGIGDPYSNAQNMQSLFGKMIRLDINVQNAPYYAIPVDNPFINTPNARPEIFALGLRNPWRWSFDDLTGDIWFGDVGQDTWEEINFTRYAEASGANYGWHCYEGDETYNRQNCVQQSNYRFPVFKYKHGVNNGGFSVIGGYVYHGTSFPLLKGYYVCADYISGNAWLIHPNGTGNWAVTIQNNVASNIVSFGEDESGELYAASQNGNIYQVSTANTEEQPDKGNYIFPTFVDNGNITLVMQDYFEYASIIDMQGHQLFQQRLAQSGTMQLKIPSLAAGFYILKLSGTQDKKFKIFIK